ncbi:MAG: GNAT family N-acetyltransferase [Clostridiales bacterium]|nr:GNAT family N-acetyltransferase [Clostridiales bacterium]
MLRGVGADESEGASAFACEASAGVKFRIVEGLSQIQAEDVVRLLKTTYWASQRPAEKIEKSMRHSDCFGIYVDGEPHLVGFARVITDYATTFYLADVIIDESQRGNGLGKTLVSYILARPKYVGLRGILLTKDAHGLYEKYGFERQDGRFMSRSAIQPQD